MGSRRQRALPRALAGACATLLFLGACSGDEGAPAAAGDEKAGRRSQSVPDPECIDGQSASEKKIDRPAVALKIENSAAARPQSGLDKADLVFEEIVEGGITRFLAIFHCGQSVKAGPVRSARFDDPKLALPITRVLGYSGANLIVERELRKRKMIALNELNSGDAFFRVPPGSRDIHSLYANTEKVRAQAKKAKPPSKALFEFGSLPGGVKRARLVSVNFTPSNTIEYRWEGGAWRRYEAGRPFVTSAGGQIAVPNLLIQQVRVNNSRNIVDPAGNPSPDILLEGRGKLLLFRGGKVVKGVWRIDEEAGAPVYETKSGEALVFEAGPIWVELVPSKKGQVKGSFSFE